MGSPDLEDRVLIFMPVGRDGSAAAEFIRRAGLAPTVCADLAQFMLEVARGGAAAVLAEEGLFGQDFSGLTGWAEAQPAWSDLPFVVLTSRQEQPAIGRWRSQLIADLRNVSLLERPVQAITLTSTVRVAVRARRRQYLVRDLLEARTRAADDLERQVEARTEELREQMAERERVEEALRQSQKLEALGQLTGGVAHDFNNLLMVISGGLEILESQSDPARRRRLLEGMRQAAQRGSGLTRQLLAFSRRSPLKPQPVDLTVQVGGMRELLDRSLRGDVAVTLNFADGVWPVAVDPGELELVVLNLAVNARDAMPDGGEIEIRAENVREDLGAGEAEYVRLSVTDNGEGMSAAVKAHVFEPFYTTKEIGRGSGLGLAQVHGFAVQSGGAVQIDSEVGQGTTVSILLPRSVDAPTKPEHTVADSHAEGRGLTRKGAILLVEDDDEVAALVAEMLEQLGYEVTRAASGSAALGALANDRAIDLVLSDVMMPGGMSGVDLAREIRRRRADLPVLLTSGYAGAAQDRADADGMRLLPKPYRLDELAAALESVRAAH